jgi:hypothetical protein
MKYLAFVAALGLTGCCGTSNAPAMLKPVPYAAPAASPCAPAAPAEAPKASPSSCNAPAMAPSSSGVPMSTVAMPTFVAKAAVVPPNVIICIVGFVRCLVDTLVAPLKP